MINKNKRGQVTLFIIIAIVIVAAIVLIIFLRHGFRKELAEVDVAEVKEYISSCLDLKTKEAVLFIARQGGYYTLPAESINFLDEQAAYYWKSNKNLVPTIADVEKELNAWLEDNVQDCFVLAGYDITKESCSVSSAIAETVSVGFDCPIVIKKGAAVSRIEAFSSSVDAPVAKLLDVSGRAVENYAEKPGYFCVTCFDEIAAVNNVTITAVPITKEIFESEHIWFLITDKNKKIEDKNMTWRFVVELK